MRIGDLSVTLIPVGGGNLIEQGNGQILARPGQVYSVHIHNSRSTRAVARVSLDGNNVTEGGIIVPSYSGVTIERPVTAGENGRFTVLAEGNEAAFGLDGGRNNPNLGIIEVRAQWEKPVTYTTHTIWNNGYYNTNIVGSSSILRSANFTPTSSVNLNSEPAGASINYSATFMPDSVMPQPTVERAAGTGLTGRSEQRFSTAYVGDLEAGETVIVMRLVIGTEAAVNGPRPLPGVSGAPPRPAPLP